MLTTDHTIAKLRKVGVLTDEGLDLSPLEDAESFGKDQYYITSHAILWEVAKRYNLTYRTALDGRFVFETEAACGVEAKWFAQTIMREWSGNELNWMEKLEAPGLLNVRRAEISDERQRCRLRWMDKHAAYEIRLLVYYRIDNGYLQDYDDVDPNIAMRRIMNPTPNNLELRKYRPFCSPAYEVRIAPTNVIRNFGGLWRSEEEEEEEEEEEVIIAPSKPETYDWRAYDRRVQNEEEVSNLLWLLYLRDVKRGSVESQAIADGLDPSKLSTYTALTTTRLKILDRIAEKISPHRNRLDTEQSSAHSVSVETPRPHTPTAVQNVVDVNSSQSSDGTPYTSAHSAGVETPRPRTPTAVQNVVDTISSPSSDSSNSGTQSSDRTGSSPNTSLSSETSSATSSAKSSPPRTKMPRCLPHKTDHVGLIAGLGLGRSDVVRSKLRVFSGLDRALEEGDQCQRRRERTSDRESG